MVAREPPPSPHDLLTLPSLALRPRGTGKPPHREGKVRWLAEHQSQRLTLAHPEAPARDRLFAQHPLQLAALDAHADGAVLEPHTVGDLAERHAVAAPKHQPGDREAVSRAARSTSIAFSASSPFDAVFRKNPVWSAGASYPSWMVASMPALYSAIAATGPATPPPMISAVVMTALT
jgi:hypothetical protein